MSLVKEATLWRRHDIRDKYHKHKQLLIKHAILVTIALLARLSPTYQVNPAHKLNSVQWKGNLTRVKGGSFSQDEMMLESTKIQNT